jgi:hypothetical protein
MLRTRLCSEEVALAGQQIYRKVKGRELTLNAEP